MGQVKPAEPAKLIVGALSAFPEAWAAARARLVERYGPIDLEAGPLDFHFTNYYAEEMGAGLRRWFAAFARLVAQEELSAVKAETNRLEAELVSPDWPVARAVNLDPGYLVPGKLVLATTKDQAHRLCIGGGLFAEVTLRYSGGRFVANEWTYPDYRSEPYHQFFTRVREALRAQLRAGPS